MLVCLAVPNCVVCSTASQQPSISLHESFGRHTLTQPYHEDHMRHTLTQMPLDAHTEHTLTQPLHEAHPSHTLTQPLHKDPTIHTNDLVIRTVPPRNKQVGVASSNGHTSVQDPPQADTIQPVDWEVNKICPCASYTIITPPPVFQSLGAMGQQRQRAVQTLLTTEQGLCDRLTMGVETYVDPLRSVLPQESHQKMFLGLTKVINDQSDSSKVLCHLSYYSSVVFPWRYWHS